MLDLHATDVIVARATPPGTGAVGILRLSGAGAVALVTILLRGNDPHRWIAQGYRTLELYTLYDPVDGTPLDSALLVPFAAEASFTGEEVVEIQGHGAPVVLDALQQACLKAGARLAEPGEFSYRAFRAGKLDLSEAEGLLTLANATGRITQEGGLSLLQGGLRKAVVQLKKELIDLLARIEVVFDYPEDQLAGYDQTQLGTDLARFAGALHQLLRSWETQQSLVDGWKVVLLGAPNVGKSSLLNALVGINRALVHGTPGTTRDVVEAVLLRDGHKFVLYDTAGQRETTDAVEAAGLALAERYVANADIVLHVLDGTQPPTEIDAALIRLAPDQPHIVVANKADLPPHPALGEWCDLAELRAVLPVSALTGEGIEALQNMLVALTGTLTGSSDQAAAQYLTQRQYACLSAALGEVDRAIAAVAQGIPEDLIATHLREALSQLLAITGETYDVAVLQAIFSQFCVGK